MLRLDSWVTTHEELDLLIQQGHGGPTKEKFVRRYLWWVD